MSAKFRNLMLAGALAFSIPGVASAFWISVCYANYCGHCNANGFCVDCDTSTGHCVPRL